MTSTNPTSNVKGRGVVGLSITWGLIGAVAAGVIHVLHALAVALN